MSRNRRRLPLAVTLVLAPALCGLLCPGSARAASGVVDQSQLVQNTYGMIGGGDRTGEVFTAGQFGYLHKISLYLGQYVSSPVQGLVTVDIETVTADGLPSGTRIAHGSIPASAVPAAPGWVDIIVSGAFVARDTKYALIVRTTDRIVLWYGDCGGDVKPYSRGYWVSEAGGGWSKILTNQDWTFKTYVIPDVLDQAQAQTSGTGSGTMAIGSANVAQTFTAGAYGQLHHVSLYLTNSALSPATAPVTISIRKATSSGLPGTEITRGTIPLEAIPPPSVRAWVDATVDPVILTAGTKYAIVLSSGGGAMLVFAGQLYSGGSLMYGQGSNWEVDAHDAAFSTYIMPPQLDRSQTMTNGGYLEVFNGSDYYMDWGGAAQVFTAGVSGPLESVRVAVETTWAIDPLTVSFQMARDGKPSGFDLARTTIPAGAVSGGDWNPAWVTLTFPGVKVEAGTQYAIVMTVPNNGAFRWYGALGNWGFDTGGYALKTETSNHIWTVHEGDMAFETYVLPSKPLVTRESGPVIDSCSNGVCPQASGGFNRTDLGGGVRSAFHFTQRPNENLTGAFEFDDPEPGGLTLRGCGTDSVACRLKVSTLVCTDAHAMTVEGTYAPMGETPVYFTLNLTGAGDGPGRFSLTTRSYSYTLSGERIVDVTCPAAPGGAGSVR